MLNIVTEHVAGELTFHLQGRLVRGNDTDILCAALRHDRREIVLDLSGVTAIDAAGMGALISLQAAGFYLRLTDPIPSVRELLSRTKLDSVFEITETAGVGRVASAAPSHLSM